MTRVTFYVHKGSLKDGLRTLCRVADKASRQGHRIYVYAPESAMRQQFDELLWTFDDRSFVAHDSDPDSGAAVVLGNAEPPSGFEDILVNLSDEIAPGFSRCERVIEIVAGEDAQRQAARSRWKHYQDRGYPLDSHNI